MKNIIFVLWPVLVMGGVFNDLKTKYIDECPILIENKYYDVCYGIDYKSPIAGITRLNNNVNVKNIKKHYYFRSDDRLPKRYRNYSSRFKNSKFNLGHTIVSDADMDFSIKSLKDTYIMTNITAQYERTNKYSYLAIEEYIRALATKYHYVDVLTLIVYGDKKLSDIGIPKTYFKILHYKDYQQCFKIPNDNIVYKLDDMIIDCDEVIKELKWTMKK